MKKIILPVLVVIPLAALSQSGQNHNVHPDHRILDPLNQQVCGSNMEAEYVFSENPALRVQDEQDRAAFELAYQHYLATYDPFARSTYVVPVVVHVVHEYGVENISDEQIFDALRILNEDFNMLNADLANVVPAFQPVIGNTSFEFRLATKDPQGNCHPGITRTFMPGAGTHDTGDNQEVRDFVEAAHGNWPQNMYMNIFVVKSIGGAAAYTNNPGNWYSATGMGGSIYTGHTYFGSIGTSNSTNGHIISHEVGHWFNLSHVWGSNNSAGDAGSCSTDDNVTDTPNCIGGTCNYTLQTCGSLDNVQNIMDYTGGCRAMFTQGQAARMQTAITGNTADRNNLWSSQNLIATGVNTAGQLCDVAFSSNTKIVCAGQSIEFQDDSYHNINSRNWSFQGGTPSSSTLENPTVIYNVPGVYDVALTASDGTNSSMITKSDYVIVLEDQGNTVPFHEGFEQTTVIPDNDLWMVYDQNLQGTWELTSLGGSGGTFHSARLGNYGNIDGSKDELISGPFDLSWVDPADPVLLTFEYAYRKTDPSNDEWLRVFISADCGETWVLRKNLHGDNLSPLVQGTAYIGGGPQEWYFAVVTNITPNYYVSNFMFKFQFENDGGNNLYIDNINLYPESMTGLSGIETNNELSIFPNPAGNTTTLKLSAEAGRVYKISVLSMMGQEIQLVHHGQLMEGLNNVDFDTSELAPGVYLVQVESEGVTRSVKLVKD